MGEDPVAEGRRPLPPFPSQRESAIKGRRSGRIALLRDTNAAEEKHAGAAAANLEVRARDSGGKRRRQ